MICSKTLHKPQDAQSSIANLGCIIAYQFLLEHDQCSVMQSGIKGARNQVSSLFPFLENAKLCVWLCKELFRDTEAENVMGVDTSEEQSYT